MKEGLMTLLACVMIVKYVIVAALINYLFVLLGLTSMSFGIVALITIIFIVNSFKISTKEIRSN